MTTAAARLGAAVGYVAHMESLRMMAVVALVVSALEQTAALPPLAFAAAPILIVARAVHGGYFYLVFRKAAAGSLRLPQLRDYRDSWDVLIFPLLQGLVVSVWIWAPLLVYVALSGDWHDFLQRQQLHPLSLFRGRSYQLYSLLALQMLYLPAALVASAARGSLWRLLDPTFGLRLSLRAPRAYAMSYALVVMLLLAGFLMHTAGALLRQALPIPVATPILAHLLALWVPLAQMRLLGDFVWEQRERLRAS